MILQPIKLVAIASLASALVETGTYRNPNPRPYDNCDAADLVQLSTCCNDILAGLDDCKSGDLACECCALQSMDRLCYTLCPGNPSASFLTVLLDDCVSLNDVNACNIPFKKVDGTRHTAHVHRNADASLTQPPLANLVSALGVGDETTETETEVRPKPKVNLILGNLTKLESQGFHHVATDAFATALAAVLMCVFVH